VSGGRSRTVWRRTLAGLLPLLAGDWPRKARRAHRYHHRMLLISEDGGTSWRCARLADFVDGAVARASADAQQ